MSTNQRSTSVMGSRAGEKSYFDQQREALMGEIAISFEHVLANINKLNRSLEAINAVGNEFSSVEALWSQFENVMGKEAEETVKPENEEEEDTSMEDHHVKKEEAER